MNRPLETVLTPEIKQQLREPLSWRKGTPIYVEIYRRLQQLIVDGIFQKGDRLPSETELAELMRIGRTSLRSAIILLYEDGYVKTFHGKGTYVIYGGDREKRDNPGEFTDRYLLPARRLQRMGGCVTQDYTAHRANSYDAFIDECLNMNGEKVNSLARLYSLDGAHAILSYCYYPAAVYGETPLQDKNEIDPILENYFDRHVSYVTSTFTAVPSSGVKNTDAGIKFEGNHFLLVSSTWFSAEDKPLAYCKDYYCTDVVRYRIKTPIKSTEGDL
jgi:DNA-binding GntR family transcriptional regulator